MSQVEKKDHWIIKIHIKMNESGTALEIIHKDSSYFYYNGTISFIICN